MREGGDRVRDGGGNRGRRDRFRTSLAKWPTPGPSLTLAALLAGRAVLALGGWTLGTDVGQLPLWLIGDGVLVTAALLDLLVSPGPGHLVVRREAPKMLSLYEPYGIKIVVENRSKFPLQLVIRDEPPRPFSRSESILRLRVAAQSTNSITYEVTPEERGEFHFEGCTVRFATRLSLWRRQLRRPLPQAARVYPHTPALRRRPLRSPRRRLHEAGVRRGRAANHGMEFERVREYVPDDEPRRINWHATARRGGRLMANHYQAPRNQLVVLAFDAGRLGAMRVGEGSRFDHAVSAGLRLGVSALESGDHIGAVVFADEVFAYLPPSRGGRQLRALTRMLCDARPRYVESDYGAALRFLKARIRKRSLVCLFTDLAESEAARTLSAHLRTLQPQHLPVCISVADPALRTLAGLAPTRSRMVYEKAVAQEVMQSRQDMVATLRRYGIEVVDAPPNQIHAATVDAYLDIKARAKL